jgi:hypothetical protein
MIPADARKEGCNTTKSSTPESRQDNDEDPEFLM